MSSDPLQSKNTQINQKGNPKMNSTVFCVCAENKYPYWGKAPSGCIVYFTSKNTGVCFVKDDISKVGENCSNWAESIFENLNISEIKLIEKFVTEHTREITL